MSTLKRLSLSSPFRSQIEEALPPLCQPLNTRSNRASCIFAFKAWLTIITDNLFNYGFSEDSVLSRLGRFTNDFVCTTEPSLVLMCCKVAYDLLLDVISRKVELTYLGFKDRVSTSFTETINMDAFLAPVNRQLSVILNGKSVYENGVWSSDFTNEVKSVLAFFGFLIKLPLSNTMLESKALDDYMALEVNYPKMIVSNPYLPKLECLLANWLKDFQYDGSRCQHGKGAVADSKSYQLDKYRNLSSDSLLEYLFRENYEDGFTAFAPLGLRINPLKRVSKIVFVPKNVSKLRTISMEPASLQYVQQGVMLTLYDYFKVHPYLRNHIQLDDQTVNQSLAYDGSITNKYATIDLSQASDSVSYEIVKYAFRRIRPLYRWLIGSRSSHTMLPNGDIIKLNKFAPMGSALCFPVETLIFAAIAKIAVDEAQSDGILGIDENGQVMNHYTAYGDDIIVPTPAYSYAVRILESFNFSVNETKSYNDSPFKESCGGNYYCGREVTPIKWRCALEDNGSIGPDAYDALCSCINNCSASNFRITRAFILQFLRDNNLKPLFSEDQNKSPAIYSSHCTNFHLRRKWCASKNPQKPSYQKWEFLYNSTGVVRANNLTSEKDKEDIDSIEYFVSLRRKNDNYRVSDSQKKPWKLVTTEIRENNMSYDPRRKVLSYDVAQKLSTLSIMEKIRKFTCGKASV